MRRVKRAALGLLLAGGLLSAGTAGTAQAQARAGAAAAVATAPGYSTPADSTPAGSAVTSVTATTSQIVVAGRLAAADDPAGTSLVLYALDPARDDSFCASLTPVATLAEPGASFHISAPRFQGGNDGYDDKYLVVADTPAGTRPLGTSRYPTADFPARYDYPYPRGWDKKGLSAVQMIDDADTLGASSDGTTDGWVAGQNVASVAAVTGFPDGPGTPYESTYALNATGMGVAADAPRTVRLTPAAPLDLAQADTFFAYVDCYGGAPGAAGYTATITLTSGARTLTQAVTVQHDSWNKVSVDVSSWSYRNDITGVSVSMAATGSTTPWAGDFQLDDVGYTS